MSHRPENPVPLGHRFPVVLAIMVLAGSVSIMSTDLYAPSLPHVTEVFNTTPELVKLTISLNLIIYGLAQLLFGPICDRYGRRPVFLWSLALFSVASIACGIAKSIDQLIIARVFQGLFASAEAVMCLAVFKDLFTEKQQVKGFAIYGMAVALAPAVAPIIGGYVHVFLGWEYNFFIIAALGLVTGVIVFALLGETATPDPDALKTKSILFNYRRIFLNRKFIIYGLMAGLALGFIYAFITGAPFILIDYFGVEVQHFGYYQAAIVVAFFIGSTLAAKIVDYWDPMRVLNTGLVFIIVGAILVVFLIFVGGLSPHTLAGAYMFIAFGLGPMFSVGAPKAMAAVEKSAGSTAAAFGAVEIGLSGVIAGMVSIFHDDTPRPFGYVIAVTALLILVLGIIANRIDRKEG